VGVVLQLNLQQLLELVVEVQKILVVMVVQDHLLVQNLVMVVLTLVVVQVVDLITVEMEEMVEKE
jgi:hypothetical protein